MERQKFEDSFREAFNKAEVSPSENVWTNIELDLERLEGGKMKRRILFYKFVAAASVAFAMAIGGIGYFYVRSTERSADNSIAVNDKKSNSSNSDQLSVPGSELNQQESSTMMADNAQSDHGNVKEKTDEHDAGSNGQNINTHSRQHEGIERLSANSTEKIAATNGKTVSDPVSSYASLSPENIGEEQAPYERKLPALVRQRKFELYFPKTEPDEFDLMLAREEWKEKQSKKSSYEKVWTSVGFTAGSFAGGSSGAGAAILNTANTGFQSYSISNTLSNEASASGVAYSVGVNVGTRLSKRWILQGGLNYLTQSSNYTSDALVTTDFQNYSAANSAELTKLTDRSSSAKVVPASPYSVNNNLQFLSVPLQAGYVVLNHAFAIQLNGGVSTDLFLQSTITPENGSLDKVSNGRGDDSPYRPVNFSGLIGTEFSYRFAERYRLSLAPGIRYPFGSIYKSETGLQANPVTLDVGLRFRYIFQ
ncbi:MAG TPA: outer membrane beta-barrel protein [Cyclobacteriaceae bacterium]|nr:outer membrane beta-barrel protein [Cyclobacteriaceae bacterium]